MNKLVIENIIIEKSDKDISLGVNYEFSNSINLICGKNEAGKSSLMNFIKDGLFREKGVDTGKIFFSVANSFYRCDIKNAPKLDARCKLYDSSDSPSDYNIIEKNINKKSFEQGFFINLDDLMSIQNKDTSTLIDMMKDSSCDKLKNFIDKTKTTVKKTLGDNGRLTKEVTSILEKISDLNTRINELSNSENLYDSVIRSINLLNEEINEISKTQNYIQISSELQNYYNNINSYKENYSKIFINFNEKLFNQREKCFEFAGLLGDYKHFSNKLEENNKKLEEINNKLDLNKQKLNNDFLLISQMTN